MKVSMTRKLLSTGAVAFAALGFGVAAAETHVTPPHQHWHFQAFAEYSLVPFGAETTPGDPDEHDHVKSKKEAFCLANTDVVDLTGDGAAWKVDNTDLATACGERASPVALEMSAASAVNFARTVSASSASSPFGPNTFGKKRGWILPSMTLASVTVSGPPRR